MVCRNHNYHRGHTKLIFHTSKYKMPQPIPTPHVHPAMDAGNGYFLHFARKYGCRRVSKVCSTPGQLLKDTYIGKLFHQRLNIILHQPGCETTYGPTSASCLAIAGVPSVKGKWRINEIRNRKFLDKPRGFVSA